MLLLSFACAAGLSRTGIRPLVARETRRQTADESLSRIEVHSLGEVRESRHTFCS